MTSVVEPRRALPPVGAVAVVMAGGALGTGARFALGQRFPVAAGAFPTTTLVENVVGAALLGALLTLLAVGAGRPMWIRLLLATGLLGSFTTFSTFTTETVLLVRDGRPGTAAAYVAATTVLGVAAAALGVAAGRRLGAAGDRS